MFKQSGEGGGARFWRDTAWAPELHGLMARFIDGAATATRPVYRNYSAGFGVWGAAQPGVARLDAGPRVTMKVRDNVNLHLDYRYKLVGNAQPGSGPVLTLAGDF